jgi:hypothetical protein
VFILIEVLQNQNIVLHLPINKSQNIYLLTKSNTMRLFNSFKPTENSNRIVSELNANVLTGTFKSTIGTQLADLYTSKHSCNKIVAHNTCSPSNCEYVETIEITFE